MLWLDTVAGVGVRNGRLLFAEKADLGMLERFYSFSTTQLRLAPFYVS